MLRAKQQHNVVWFPLMFWKPNLHQSIKKKPDSWWRVKLTSEVKMRLSSILPATVSKIYSKLNKGKKVNDKPLKRGVFLPLLNATKLGSEML